MRSSCDCECDFVFAAVAPEILEGGEYGTAADWWAFGAVLYELLTGLPPWYSQNSDEMHRQALQAPLSFPGFVSTEAKDLLQKLLNRNPKERLGSLLGGSEVKEHVFFRHIDWEMVTFREVQALIQPCISPDTIVRLWLLPDIYGWLTSSRGF